LRTAIHEILAARGVSCDVVLENEIRACRDPEQLRAWLRQAVTVSNGAQLIR